MNKQERRACASFIRTHVHNIVTLRRSDTEEHLCNIVLRPHLDPVTMLNTKLYPVILYGRSARRMVGSNLISLPWCIIKDVGSEVLVTHDGWSLPDEFIQRMHTKHGIVVTQRFCVKTDETMFPVADDLTTLYNFAQMFRKFVGAYTTIVSRGPVLYAALRNKITFARQSGTRLVIDSRNLYRDQTLADLFDELRNLHE